MTITDRLNEADAAPATCEAPEPIACMTCRFWSERPPNEGQRQGDCRKALPHASVMALPTQVGGIVIKVQTYWPITNDVQFCHEHDRAEGARYVLPKPPNAPRKAPSLILNGGDA